MKKEQKIISIFRFIKIFSQDHWHLLLKSAAHNHLRIQQCKKDSELGGSCNLNFDSYSELKRYQKKVRLFTFSTSSTAISVFVVLIVFQIFFPGEKSFGATYNFVQSSWAGGATANSASHASNQTGWNQYQSKDADVLVVNGGNDLQLAIPSVQSIQETADGDFTGTVTGDGFYTDGSGKLYLKKPTSAACTAAQQCASGVCTGNVCQ